MKPLRFQRAAGALMVLVGLARGAGGVALLARGSAADPAIKAGGAAVVAAAMSLLLLAITLLGTLVQTRLKGAKW